MLYHRRAYRSITLLFISVFAEIDDIMAGEAVLKFCNYGGKFSLLFLIIGALHIL